MTFWAIIGERATLTELWAAIEAILGAAMRNEEAIEDEVSKVTEVSGGGVVVERGGISL